MVHPIIGTTSKTPMYRLLEKVIKQGECYPDYDQQWRTVWKANRLGFITDGYGDGYGGKITDKGRAVLLRLQSKEK